MLIVMRHPEGVLAGAEYAKEVAEHLDGTTQIYNPRTLTEFDQALVGHKPSLKNHLILLSSHQDLGSANQPVEVQRQLELFLASKGGLVYGVQSPSTLATWIGGLEKDPATVAKNTYLSTYRAIYSRKQVGTKYVGRITSDPHTVLIGWAPANRLKCSGIGRQVITSLPDEWGRNSEDSRPSDWSGVAFLPHSLTSEKLEPIIEWLAESNFVALGEKAHQLLDAVGEVHGAVPLPTGNGAFNRKPTTPKYGWLIRDVAKTHDIKLDWTP